MEKKIINRRDNLRVRAYKNDGIIIDRGYRHPKFNQMIIRLTYEEFNDIIEFVKEVIPE